MIFDAHGERVVETLKWGQAAYCPAVARQGTAVRLDALRGEAGRYALFVHCRTSIVERCRALYPDSFEYRGNRALVLDSATSVPREAVAFVLATAFDYHIRPA